MDLESKTHQHRHRQERRKNDLIEQIRIKTHYPCLKGLNNVAVPSLEVRNNIFHFSKKNIQQREELEIVNSKMHIFRIFLTM